MTLKPLPQLDPGSRATRRLAAGGAVALGCVAAAVAVRHARRLGADPDLKRLSSPLRGRPVGVVSRDGTRLHAEVFGDGDVPPDGRPTVVLIPGWTEQLTLFDLMTRRLVDDGYRVVAYDLRGQGASGRPPNRDFSVERYGEDVEAVLAATCAGRGDVIVAGHSLGGMSIAAWAADHDVAARAAGCVLINTGFDGLVAASKLMPAVLPGRLHHIVSTHSGMGNPLPLPPLSTPISTALIRYSSFGPTATLGHVGFYERMLMACSPRVRAAAGLMMANMDLGHALPRITVPTVVIGGDQDRLTPDSHSRKIADGLPVLDRLLILPETGHMAPLERPEEVVEAIEGLARRVAAPTAQAVGA